MAWKPDYVCVPELKSFLRIDDAEDDAELGFAITAASRAVDRATHRQFGQVAAAEDRIYTAKWWRRRCRWVIAIDDLPDDTGLTVTTDDGEIDVYTLEPVNALLEGKVYTHLVVDPDSTVKPTGAEHEVTANTDQWGWSDIPDTVKQGTLLQSSRFHARRFSPYGVAGSPETGSEVRLLARVDPDVAVALADYVRRWGAV